MIEFDFANSTFSFAVAIVSTALSIFYPLFTEGIRKIDDQYKSSMLSKHYQGELCNRLYKICLPLTLIVSFVAPFVMLNCDNSKYNIIIITAQCFFVVALVALMIWANGLIQEYYVPDVLTRHLFGNKRCKKNIKKQLLPLAVDLIHYASIRKNLDVYQKCKDFIFDNIYQEQTIASEIEVKEYKNYQFSDELANTLYALTAFAADDNYVYPSNDNILQQAVFNIFAEKYNGNQNYILIWRCLNKIAESNSDAWFRQYWEGAVQYYAFKMDGYFIQSVEMADNKKHFLELHQMVGALMTLNEKYEWLHLMLTYDRTNPPKFQLIPGTLSHIIDSLLSIENRLGKVAVLNLYSMNKIACGVSYDKGILEWVYKYFALLLIRLFSYNNYDINYSNPMQLPNLKDKNLIELEDLKKKLLLLEREIREYWYKGERIQLVRLPECEECDNVCKLIKECVDNINDIINDKSNNRKLDIARMRELQELLKEVDDSKRQNVSGIADDDMNCQYQPFVLETLLDNRLCTKDGGCYGWDNFSDALVHGIGYKVEEYKEQFLALLKPSLDISIKEQNIFKAFEKLDIKAPYIIYSAGIYLGSVDFNYNDTPVLKYSLDVTECTYNGIKVIEKASALSSLFIIKEDEMPKVEYIETNASCKFDDKDNDLTKIPDSENNLYSNIPSIIAENNSSKRIDSPVVLKIGRCVKVCSKSNLQYIRIRVVRNGDDTNTLNTLSTMETYIK